MKNIEKVSDLLSSDEGRKVFLDWAGSEITQLMLSAAKEVVHPTKPMTSDAGAVGVALGEVLGSTKVLDYLSNPFTAPKIDPMVPNYGAEGILAEET